MNTQDYSSKICWCKKPVTGFLQHTKCYNCGKLIAARPQKPIDMKNYVIKKGNRFWKKGDRGYSFREEDAKLFTEEEALEIINRPNTDKTMHKI